MLSQKTFFPQIINDLLSPISFDRDLYGNVLYSPIYFLYFFIYLFFSIRRYSTLITNNIYVLT